MVSSFYATLKEGPKDKQDWGIQFVPGPKQRRLIMRSTRLKSARLGVCLVLIFAFPFIAGADEYSQFLVKSTPAGAKIFIDNMYYGKTPMNLEMVEGEYLLELRKNGHESHEENIVIRPRRFQRIHVDLAPSGRYGKLEIDSTPTGAKLFIDGTFYQRTPALISLEGGNYNIRLEKEGFNTARDEIVIIGKERLRLNLKLDPRERYGDLVVKSRPSGARVFVNDRYYELTPARIELREGSYRIKVEKDDYQSGGRQVSVAGNKQARAFFDLKPVERYGSVEISSSPPDCKVFIDDAFYDKTPFAARLLAGKHDITLKKRGWKTHTDEITIRGGESVHRKYRMKRKPIPPPPKATLRVRSTPQGARVRIKGDFHGETPVDIKLNPGIYQVEIDKKGYRKYQERIELGIGELQPMWVELEKIKPVVRYGKLTITSNKKAKVIIDGEYRGKTPLTVRLARGPHRLKVKRKHFRDFKDEVRIDAGREHRLNVILARKESASHVQRRGVIDIVSKPLSAKIFIDDQFQGRTPETLKLRPGKYHLEIRHKGYRPFRRKLRVEPGDNRPVRADLRWKGHDTPSSLIHEMIKDAINKD